MNQTTVICIERDPYEPPVIEWLDNITEFLERNGISYTGRSIMLPCGLFAYCFEILDMQFLPLIKIRFPNMYLTEQEIYD